MKTREELFAKIKGELKVHGAIEEEVLYPALKEHAATRDIVLEAYEEPHVVDVILGELERTRVDDETWVARFTVMKENPALRGMKRGRAGKGPAGEAEEVAVGTVCAICGMAAEVVVTHEGRDDCPGVFGHASGREHVHHACENGHEWVGYPLAASV